SRTASGARPGWSCAALGRPACRRDARSCQVKAHSRPCSSVTSRASPIGVENESTTKPSSDTATMGLLLFHRWRALCERGPRLGGGICTPGAPALGAGEQLGGGARAAFDQPERTHEARVPGRERIRLAQLPHCDVLRSPFADPAELAQLGNRLFECWAR